MSRNSKKNRIVYRVRTKVSGGFFGSRMLQGSSVRKRSNKSNGSRILSVTKVSPEEILRIGEFFKLGENLMKEFQKSSKENQSVQRDSRYLRQDSPEKGLERSRNSTVSTRTSQNQRS